MEGTFGVGNNLKNEISNIKKERSLLYRNEESFDDINERLYELETELKNTMDYSKRKSAKPLFKRKKT